MTMFEQKTGSRLDAMYELYDAVYPIYMKKLQSAIDATNHGNLDDIIRTDTEWRAIDKYMHMINLEISECLKSYGIVLQGES